MVLIETVGQETKIRDSETSREKIENPRRKEAQETQEISRLIQNASEISRFEQKFPRPWIFGYHSPPLKMNATD